eukprot:jgi/Chlat1/576/Chrsp103S00015
MDGADPAANLSPAQKAELQQFILREQQKAVFNELVAKLSDVCWDKCITKPGSRLDSSESACLSYCAHRFLDASNIVLQHFERRGGGNGRAPSFG